MKLNTLEHLRCRRRQAGMTTLGLIILVVFVGLFAFATREVDRDLKLKGRK